MFALAQDPTSLDNLHDIVVPEPTAWWPPAPAWYVLLALVIASAIALAVKAVRNWWENRYREAALAELGQLRESVQHASNPSDAVHSLDRLLKRVALARWPRQEVAPLAGERWIAFLNRTGHREAFTTKEAESIRNVAYSRQKSEQLTLKQLEQLYVAAECWIREHKGPPKQLARREQERQP